MKNQQKCWKGLEKNKHKSRREALKAPIFLDAIHCHHPSFSLEQAANPNLQSHQWRANLLSAHQTSARCLSQCRRVCHEQLAAVKGAQCSSVSIWPSYFQQHYLLQREAVITCKAFLAAIIFTPVLDGWSHNSLQYPPFFQIVLC